MASQKNKGSKPKSAPSPVKNGYLILYNALSAMAWSVVLARTISTAGKHGPQFVIFAAGEWTQWTQTMACLEIVHSLLGTCHSIPLSLTAEPPGRSEKAAMRLILTLLLDIQVSFALPS